MPAAGLCDPMRPRVSATALTRALLPLYVYCGLNECAVDLTMIIEMYNMHELSCCEAAMITQLSAT